MEQRKQFKRFNNGATRDKSSILTDIKRLILVYMPIYKNMPKFERMDGAPRHIKTCAFNMMRDFCIAYNCPEERDHYIRLMIGEYYSILAMFDILKSTGIVTEDKLLKIAEILNKTEEGIRRWRASLKDSSSGADAARRCPSDYES